MADGVIFTEAAFRQLRRELDEQRREISNLRRNLAHISTRRHENGGFIPDYCRNGEALASGGTVSSASLTGWSFSSVIVGDELGFGTDDVFEISGGELTVLKGGLYFLTIDVPMQVANASGQVVTLEAFLQKQALGTGSWAYTRLKVRCVSNVNGGGSNTAEEWATYNGVTLNATDKLRIATSGQLSSGSWPGGVSIGPVYLQYAKIFRAEPPPGTVY